jgi:hypothetical protein
LKLLICLIKHYFVSNLGRFKNSLIIINKNFNIFVVYNMVYMSGGKAARNQASIVNRTNVCGGPKKAGLAPRVGWYLSSNVNLIRAPQKIPLICVPNTTTQTQRTGYRATLGPQ